jgi:hypothetical protein
LVELKRFACMLNEKMIVYRALRAPLINGSGISGNRGEDSGMSLGRFSGDNRVTDNGSPSSSEELGRRPEGLVDDTCELGHCG